MQNNFDSPTGSTEPQLKQKEASNIVSARCVC